MRASQLEIEVERLRVAVRSARSHSRSSCSDRRFQSRDSCTSGTSRTATSARAGTGSEAPAAARRSRWMSARRRSASARTGPHINTIELAERIAQVTAGVQLARPRQRRLRRADNGSGSSTPAGVAGRRAPLRAPTARIRSAGRPPASRRNDERREPSHHPLSAARRARPGGAWRGARGSDRMRMVRGRAARRGSGDRERCGRYHCPGLRLASAARAPSRPRRRYRRHAVMEHSSVSRWRSASALRARSMYARARSW